MKWKLLKWQISIYHPKYFYLPLLFPLPFLFTPENERRTHDTYSPVPDNHGSAEERGVEHEGDERLEVRGDGDRQNVPNHFYSVHHHRNHHRPTVGATHHRHVIQICSDNRLDRVGGRRGSCVAHRCGRRGTRTGQGRLRWRSRLPRLL